MVPLSKPTQRDALWRSAAGETADNPLGHLAPLLAAAREEFVRQALQGRGDRAALARYTDQTDRLVRQIFGAAQDLTDTPLIVCAIGGYGRRALCLHSDLDLLIVFQGAIAAPEERAASALLQPLWDLRLAIGHHVRELSEFDRLEMGNPEFVLALLDARLVAGDDRLFAVLLERVRDATAHHVERLDVLLSLVSQRHVRFNDAFYQLEPDVKDAPGALRDISAIRMMRSIAADTFDGTVQFDESRLDRAEDLFTRIRSVLHAQSGRNMNVLKHELQERAAEALGYQGSHAGKRVEALMADYFRHARAVTRSLESSRRMIAPAVAQIERRRIGKFLDVGADGVRFADSRATRMPELWIEAFRVALANGCAVSEVALACIEQNIGRYAVDDFVSTEDSRQQLLKLLSPRAGLYARLSEMHECGLLGCLFPEFEKVHSRVIRDFYHRYTVDEHTLLAIRTIESLRSSPSSERQRFSGLLDEIDAPQLLILALLYHDVGKWRDEEHVSESVRLAQPMFDRFQMSDEGRRVVEFLIANHLEMSRVAFHRDSEDPQVVARFAAVVGNTDLLKMLCLLTLADIEAVSPEALTPWKEELLWRLYVDTYNQLTRGYADDRVEKDQAGLAVLMAGRPEEISTEELSRFISGLPRRYLALYGLASIYRHVRLSRDIHPNEVHASLEKHGDVWELSVVTLDKPYLFSNVCGLLSYFGMNIHRGQAITTPDGLVLDVFEFSDDEKFLAQNVWASTEIHRLLHAVVEQSVNVPTLLRGKQQSVIYRHRRMLDPIVQLDNEHSQRFTVLEIVADDALGLLYRISRTVSRQGCNVELALISTEGTKAVDVLHVTKGGRKLSSTEQFALKEALERTLEGAHEAD
jgi:[protein-PII] uridylyltransferase